MGRLNISAVNQIRGPWLLSHDNLESLNNLFIEIDNKLNFALAKNIEKLAKQQMEEECQNLDLAKRISKLQKKFNFKHKSAKVTFVDGSTFEANDIKEILHHINGTSSLTPIELYIRTINGNHDNEFNLIINSNPSKEDVDFEYRIRCLDYDIQLEIKTLIDKWVRENKAPQPLQIWSNKLVYLVWIVSVVVILISYGNLSTTTSKAEIYKKELKQEAQKVIEKKSYANDTESTLLLILKLQSDYIPDKMNSETTVVYDKNAKKTLIATLIIFFISLFRPKTIIGVGQKYKWYLFYKFWWRYIIVGGLSLLFTTLLADSIIHFINW